MKDISEIKNKRAKICHLRNQKRLRDTHGEKLVSIISKALRKNILLNEFIDTKKPPPIEWPPDIRKAPGLVAAYISECDAEALLNCFKRVLSELNGAIGFHDKSYLGYADVHEVDPTSLLELAKYAEDSVVFHNSEPEGIIMVDCYKNQLGGPFSILVQGAGLIFELTKCFPGPKHAK